LVTDFSRQISVLSVKGISSTASLTLKMTTVYYIESRI